MKKIACVGYHCTGAGVIDDLFREFDNVCQGAYECEARMLQDPDCISDLEFNLVENPHRLNSGFAIKRFKKYVDRTNLTYRRIFGKQWKECSYKYAENLAKINYKGYWHGDIWLQSTVSQYINLFRKALNKLRPKSMRHPSWYNYFPNLYTYHAILSEDDFLKRTQEYIDELCCVMNKDKKEYVLLDQVLSPSNPERYMRYVKDMKVVIVDRDPRDVYITVSNYKDHVLPKDPHEFCTVYRDTRPNKSFNENPNVMYVTFEDMIYDYDRMVKKVLDFVGIDSSHHITPRLHFDPSKSIRGTKQWERYPEYSDAVKIIEEELPEFLHQY